MTTYRLDLNFSELLDIRTALSSEVDRFAVHIRSGNPHPLIVRSSDNYLAILDRLRHLQPLESSPAPAASMPAGSFDGTAGAAGGA